MRNAVIRKKRLAEQRLLERFMRMPQRIILGAEPLTVDGITSIRGPHGMPLRTF